MATIDKKLWKVTESEVLMGRERAYPLSASDKRNLEKLMIALNLIRDLYGKPLRVTSGYRPGAFNKAANGAQRSSHMTCEACDFADADGSFDKWCMDHLDILEGAGLYLEDPASTPTWTHLQIRRPASGKRVFKP